MFFIIQQEKVGTDLVRKAIRLINQQQDSPKSYSLDLMVTPRGTAITEVHNFLGIVLYSMDWDEDLLIALKQGMEYVLRYNKQTPLFSNFNT